MSKFSSSTDMFMNLNQCFQINSKALYDNSSAAFISIQSVIYSSWHVFDMYFIDFCLHTQLDFLVQIPQTQFFLSERKN